MKKKRWRVACSFLLSFLLTSGSVFAAPANGTLETEENAAQKSTVLSETPSADPLQAKEETFDEKMLRISSLFAVPKDNVALNATAGAYHVEPDTTFYAKNAVDGSAKTRWASGPWTDRDPNTSGIQGDECLVLDLGQAYSFNTLSIHWEAAYANKYEVQISSDTADVDDFLHDVDWDQTIYTDNQSDGGQQYLILDDIYQSRYIRLHMTETSSEWGSSIWEFQAYNRPDSYYLELGKTVVEELKLNAFPQADFTVPAECAGDPSESAPKIKIAWSSENSAIQFGEAADGKVTAKVTIPSDQAVTGNIKATITYQALSQDVVIPMTVKPSNDLLIDYKVYPVPQDMNYGTGSNLPITDTVVVVTPNAAISQETKDRAREVLENNGFQVEFSDALDPANTNSCLVLDLYDPSKYPSLANTALAQPEGGALGEENVYDTHAVLITPNAATGVAELTVIGKHSQAAYYGLASVDQLLAQSREEADGSKTVSTVSIVDYANSKYRGIIEGFYGYAYSKEDILSLLDYGKKYKMNTFMYGPKADPYHLGNWRDPYPTTLTDEERRNGMLTQEDIRQIAAQAKKDGIDFVWTVHPMMQGGVDITSTSGVDQGVQDVLHKYDLMYDLGVRHFGLFVDDISASLAIENSANQAKLIGDVTAAWKSRHPDEFKPLFYVPTLYSFDASGEEGLKENFGELAKLSNLDDIVFTFTGTGVWSSINNDEMARMAGYLNNQQKPMFWWNSPVNDNMDPNMFIGPLNQRYEVYTDVTDAIGMMTNPLSQAEASKVTLFGMLDYSWNTKKFQVMENWEQSFLELIPDNEPLRDAFKTFAANSAPNGIMGDKTGVTYSGIEDLIAALKAEGGATSQNMRNLRTSMMEWRDACNYLEQNLKNNPNAKYAKLYNELAPWIAKSHDTADLMIHCLDLAIGDTTDLATYYDIIAQNASFATNPAYTIKSLEGAGIDVYEANQEVLVGGSALMNFVPTAMGWARSAVEASLPTPLPAGSPVLLKHNSINAPLSLVKTAAGFEITGLANVALGKNAYVGASFPELATFKNLDELQKNAPSGLTLQISTNGRSWIDYTADTAANQKSSFRLVNRTDSAVTFQEDVLTIDVQMLTPSKVIEVTNSGRGHYQNNPLSNLADGDWTTSYWSSGSPKQDEWFQIEYETPFTLTDLTLGFHTGDNLDETASLQVSEDGTTWTEVGVLNGNILPKIEEIEGNSYQVFKVDGLNQQVKYVRWTITEILPGYSNWMRCYEVVANNGAVKNGISAVSGKGMAILIDSDPATVYVPVEPDTITYLLLTPDKINTIDLYMKPGAAMPKIQVEASGELTAVAAQAGSMPYHYVIDTSSMKAVSAIILSWDEGTMPKALFDILYQTGTGDDQFDQSNPDHSDGGGSSGGNGGGGSGATVGGGGSNDKKPPVEPDNKTTATDGYEITRSTDSETGAQIVTVTVSDKAIENSTNSMVKLPVSDIKAGSNSANATTVTVTLPDTAKNVKLSIPVTNLTNGVVAAIVKPDGSKEIVKKAFSLDGTLIVPVSGSVTLQIYNNAKAFSDMPSSHWAYHAIQFVTSRELFQGTDANSFSPDKPMTRAMFASVLYRLEGQPSAGKNPFADVPEGQYYTDAVAWASANRFVTGTGSGFDPNGNVTREQLVSILFRYAGSPASTGSLAGYQDAGNVSSWAKDAMAWAISSNIISGKGENLLAASENATRAEVAAILERFLSRSSL